jgi:hypothetical protein
MGSESESPRTEGAQHPWQISFPTPWEKVFKGRMQPLISNVQVVGAQAQHPSVPLAFHLLYGSVVPGSGSNEKKRKKPTAEPRRVQKFICLHHETQKAV